MQPSARAIGTAQRVASSIALALASTMRSRGSRARADGYTTSFGPSCRANSWNLPDLESVRPFGAVASGVAGQDEPGEPCAGEQQREAGGGEQAPASGVAWRGRRG